MTDIITSVEQITPAWLTAALQRSGALEQGQVTDMAWESKATYTATAAPLRVSYSPDAPTTAPRSLFLKLGRRKPEVDFYRFIWPETKDVPVIRCYDAAFADHLGQSHLLMDDVSTTHAEPPDALPLPRKSCEEIVDILARFHAQWWEHPRLSGDVGSVADDVPGFIFRQAQSGFGHFVDSLGDRLSEKRRRAYERILSAWPLPEWKGRIQDRQAVTLVHGDTHWWNFMFPRQSGPIYLMDWAVWHINIGASDVAYMLGQLCYPEWRARFEQSLVHYYYTRLIEYGVQRYDWAQCWHDYRLMMVFHTLWPIFHHQFAPNGIWYRNLECCISAFEDLECAELLR